MKERVDRQFRAKRRCRIPFQVRSRTEQFPHFGYGEDVRLEPLMIWRKGTGVRNEAMRFGPAAIQTEAPNLQHANPPNPRSNVFVGVTPRLKRGSIQVRVLCALVAEEPIQGLQRSGWKIETPPQSPLQIHIPSEDGRQARRKHRGERRGSFHHCPSFPARPPGTASATSRRSPVANRRYMDVASAVRCPRMSPMVLRGVPFLRRRRAYAWRMQCGPW